MLKHNELKALLEKARNKCDRFDAIDRKHGNPTPAQAGTSVGDAMAAIQAGLVTGDINCIAEAYVLLERAEGGAKSHG